MLAEPLTTTAVIGIAPSNPQKKFPTPCATNSLFTGVILLCLSSLSIASTQSNVSKVAKNSYQNTIFPNFIIAEDFRKTREFYFQQKYYQGILPIDLFLERKKNRNTLKHN